MLKQNERSVSKDYQTAHGQDSQSDLNSSKGVKFSSKKKSPLKQMIAKS